jgi:hypothetical protein
MSIRYHHKSEPTEDYEIPFDLIYMFGPLKES